MVFSPIAIRTFVYYICATNDTHTHRRFHTQWQPRDKNGRPTAHTHIHRIHSSRTHTHTHGKQKYECEWETATSPRRCSHSSTCDCCVSSFGCVVGHRRRSRHYDHPKGLRCIECSVSCCCIDARYKNGNFVHIIRPVTVHNPSCCTDLRKIHFKTHKI